MVGAVGSKHSSKHIHTNMYMHARTHTHTHFVDTDVNIYLHDMKINIHFIFSTTDSTKNSSFPHHVYRLGVHENGKDNG